MEVKDPIPENIKIKAEFTPDEPSHGSFTLHGCGVSIKEQVRSVGIKLYAFNLYMERGTLSPEPLFLVQLDAGRSVSWTQSLEITHSTKPKLHKSTYIALRTSFTLCFVYGLIFVRNRRKREGGYNTIL